MDQVCMVIFFRQLTSSVEKITEFYLPLNSKNCLVIKTLYPVEKIKCRQRNKSQKKRMKTLQDKAAINQQNPSRMPMHF
jgi:hypothetical protein